MEFPIPRRGGLALMLGVLMVLGVAFAFYHFSHVSRQAEILRARNLRELAILARQVEDHLAAATRQLRKGEVVLAQQDGEPSSSAKDCQELAPEARGFVEKELEADSLLVGGCLWEVSSPLSSTGSEGSEKTTPWVQLHRQGSARWLSLWVPKEGRDRRLFLRLDRFLKELSLPTDFFDLLLLLDEDGRVIHQDPDSQLGIRFARLDLKEKLPRRSHQQPLQIAGRDFTLFAQPLVLRAQLRGPSLETSEQSWFVAGLASARRIRVESGILSPTTLLLLSCILALLVLSLPVLKIWVSKGHERVRRVDLLGLGTASALAMALVAILVADLYTYRALLDASDTTLEQAVNSLAAARKCGQQGEVADLGQCLTTLRSTLPPEMGFALLDARGLAVVHSTPQREGYESFLASTNGNRRLLNALNTLEATADARPVTMTYQGHLVRMVIKPLDLKQAPRWLTIFYDKEPLQRLHLDLLLWVLSASFAYVLLIVALAVLLALGWWLIRGRQDTLVGSGEAFDAGDQRMVSILGLLAATLLWMLFDPNPAAKLVAAAIIPVVALTFFLVRLIHKRALRAEPQASSSNSPTLKERAVTRWLKQIPVWLWAGAIIALVWGFEASPFQLEANVANIGFVFFFCLLVLSAFGWISMDLRGRSTSKEGRLPFGKYFWPAVATISVLFVLSVAWLFSRTCSTSVSVHWLRLAIGGTLCGIGAILWLQQPLASPNLPKDLSQGSWLARGGGVLLNALLFLLVVVALPTGLLFQAVWQAEYWDWVARGQRHMAARAQLTKSDPACSEVQDRNETQTELEDLQRRIRCAFFSTRFHKGPSSDSNPEGTGQKKKELFRTWVPIWSLLERLHRNLPLDKHRQLTEDSESLQAARQLRWTELLVKKNGRSELKLRLDPKPDAWLSDAKPPRNWKLLGPSLAGLSGLACLFFIGWTARKLLVVDFGTSPSNPDLPDQDDHLFWLGGRKELETLFPESPRYQWIDLAKPDIQKRLRKGELQRSKDVARVILPGFETLRNDPETMTHLFEQLTEWVAQDELALVLASSELISADEILAAFLTQKTADSPDSEPPGEARSSESDPPATDSPSVERLLELLAGFTIYDQVFLKVPRTELRAAAATANGRRNRNHIRLEEEAQNPRLQRACQWLRRAPKLEEKMSRAELEGIFQKAVGFYYRWVWSRCTDDEKRVLFQLAQEGMIHPKAGHIGRRLLRRGLALLPPHQGLRPMNETFRRWVHRRGQEEKLREKEKQMAARDGGWPEVRNPILLALALLSIFLLTTQQHLVTPTLGQVHQSFGQMATVFTALATGIAGLAQLVWRATSGGSG